MQPTKFLSRRSGASEDQLRCTNLPADEEAINAFLRAGTEAHTLVDVVPTAGGRRVLLFYTEYTRARPA